MVPGITPYGAYQQIAGALHERIASGAYPAGSRLPSETALRNEFSVARGTIRRSLSALKDEGLVTVAAGVGWFVRDPGKEASGGVAGTRYQRIAADLCRRIERGEFQPGQLLPGEPRVSERYGVSRETAQRALVELESAGLVMCVRGRGRVVRSKTSPDDPQASVDVR